MTSISQPLDESNLEQPAGQTATQPLQNGVQNETQTPVNLEDVFTNSYELREKTIKTLSADSFELDQKNMIELKKKDCIIVLFYIQNNESILLCDIFSKCASMVRGPKLGSVNMAREKKIAEAFVRIGEEQAHPYHWAKLKGYPFILVFRNGRPTSFYNGERSVPALSDYILTLACSSNYFEPFNMFGGAQYDNSFNIERSPNIYFNDDTHQMRTNSAQYVNYPQGSIRFGQQNSEDLKKSQSQEPQQPTA